MKFIYSTEVDISIDNGQGINEREFVDSMINGFGEKVVCVIPYPKFPEKYFNEKIEYVFPHMSKASRYLPFLISQFVRLIKLNRIYDFQAIIFRLGEIPIVVLLTSFITQKPLILKTLAGYYFFEKKNKPWIQKTYSMISLVLYKLVTKRAIMADTVSLSYIEWLNDRFGVKKNKLCIIPNGSNTDFFSPMSKVYCRKKIGLGKYDKIIGYVGALDSLRHIDKLIHLIEDLKNCGNIGLVLVGECSNDNPLLKLVEGLGMEKRVTFAGFISYNDVPLYMNTFDIAVDLSLIPMRIKDVTYNASYSQKIPQYLSCGLPVITWDTPDTNFIENEQLGYIVPYGDSTKLSIIVRRLLQKIEMDGEKLSNHIRKYAENHYSSKVLARRRIDFWDSAIKRSEDDRIYLQTQL